MTSVLLGAIPFDGHVTPMLGVARRFVELGVRVRFLTGSAYAERVRATGADFLPLPPESDVPVDAIVREHDGERVAGVAALRSDLTRVFLAPAPGQYRALLEALEAEPADVVLTETGFTGAAALLRTPGHPPIVVCGILPLALSSRDTAPFGLGLRPDSSPLGRLRNRALNWAIRNVVLRENQQEADRLLRELTGAGLDGYFMDWSRQADAIAQFTVPGFEYSRSDAPENLHFFGPVSRLAPVDAQLPSWWSELDGSRPVVHVTQGTIANVDLGELILPTLHGLADEDVLVVVSTGGRPVSDLGELPANARAAEFLPYDRLMPKLAAYVTNGGYGGLHYAFEHGVPVVAAGDTEDKPETAARVEWSGAGVDLRSGTPAPDAVRTAVRTVLNDPGYAAASARLGREISASSGVDGLLTLVRELERKAQPTRVG